MHPTAPGASGHEDGRGRAIARAVPAVVRSWECYTVGWGVQRR